MSPERAALAALMRQQSGGAMLPHFSSSVGYQRGRGLGGLIGSLIRRVIPLFSKPIVKKGLTSMGKAAATALLEAGQKSLSDQSTSFKQALGQSSRQQAKKLMEQASTAVKRKAPRGRVIKRARLPTKRVSSGSTVARRARDIFGS